MRAIFYKFNGKIKKYITIIIILSFISSSFILIALPQNISKSKNNQFPFRNTNIKTAAIIGEITLTSNEIDGNLYAHNSNFILEGNLSIIGGGDASGYLVAIEIDNQAQRTFTDVTDENGTFQINYVVSDSLNVFSSHIVKAQVLDDLGIDSIICKNNYTINVNTTSYFQINPTMQALMPGDSLNINGYINYANGTAISNAQLNYQWKNSSFAWPNTTISSNPDGSIPDISTPSNASLGTMSLTIQFQTLPNEVNFSQTIINNILIFTNITVTWNVPTSLTELQPIQIRGGITAEGNNSIKVYNRDFNLYYGGSLIGIVTTDNNGNFTFNYLIPNGAGSRTLRIELQEDSSIDSRINLTVSQANLLPFLLLNTPESEPLLSPLQWFLIIGVPSIIIAGIIAGIMGYLYYKKKALSSKVVVVILKEKMAHLKMLKESGKLREAIVYLFTDIYMELVEGKYGRKKDPTETIRDFGIISVKEFGLEPTKIYPFIQFIEATIYSRPLPLSENDFYASVDLFSPIYFSLTGGRNFVLNF
ncbi:MAG: hypothetical protein BAJALOKI1v1_570004 [Promethearchaeota archaeon]|nr:MAG: hypothetical protein BAJALOKI1v1_570004 [Candidatus Lokiarchaeota archaeon]